MGAKMINGQEIGDKLDLTRNCQRVSCVALMAGTGAVGFFAQQETQATPLCQDSCRF